MQRKLNFNDKFTVQVMVNGKPVVFQAVKDGDTFTCVDNAFRAWCKTNDVKHQDTMWLPMP